jgi:hypothetical protein
MIYSISASQYILNAHTSSYCQLAIGNVSGNHYFLGSVFLNKYYSIYDFNSGQIGLALSIDYKPKMKVWAILLIVFTCIIFLIVVTLCIRRKCKKEAPPIHNSIFEAAPDEEEPTGEKTKLKANKGHSD